MKRDMDLCRQILFALEEQYVDVVLHNLQIPEYTMEQVAYHCRILHDGGLISGYKGFFSSDGLYGFSVGALTWEGHDFLDKIREDTVWNKTKGVIRDKLLPMTLEVVKEVATTIVTAAVEKAMKGIV